MLLPPLVDHDRVLHKADAQAAVLKGKGLPSAARQTSGKARGG